MTHEIPGDANTPSDGTEQGFAALADRWADKSGYLPPGGDHSWREQEARRRFGSENASPENTDSPSEMDRAANEIDGVYDPGFKRPWALNILLPVSLATCVVFAVVVFLMPGISTSGLWGPDEPKALPDTPLRVIDAAGPDENVTSRLAAGSDVRPDKQEAVNQAPVAQPVAPPVVPPQAGPKMAMPQLRTHMPVAPEPDLQIDKPVARVAEAPPPPASSNKPVAKSLPPIGATYFAGHAPDATELKRQVDKPAVRVAEASPPRALPKKPAAKSSPPIGAAYFASHAPAKATE
jgi:hypothetical protein